MESQKRHPKHFSFEFFPPKTDKGRERLAEERAKLAELGPAFFSVTFGAGGTTQSGTLETVLDTMEATGISAAPHLSCVEGTEESILGLLKRYDEAGVKQIVALRGDIPEGMDSPGVFNHANELVAFIREHYGDRFELEVACYPEIHPEAPSAQADVDNFVRKVNAGADRAITQYFYHVNAYLDFVERCEAKGVDIPIVPGVMPIVGHDQLIRFSEGCGADVPRWIRKWLEYYQDDPDSLRQFGIDVVTRLSQQLLDVGAPGLHFYSLNKAEPTATIWKNLGLKGHF